MSSTTSRVHLGLPLALFFENCLSSKESLDTVLTSIRTGDFTKLTGKLADNEMNLAERRALGEEFSVDWQTVASNGYLINFLHLNGLKKLLHFRLGLQAEVDYLAHVAEVRVSGIKLPLVELEELAAIIEPQWKIIYSTDNAPQSQEVEIVRRHPSSLITP